MAIKVNTINPNIPLASARDDSKISMNSMKEGSTTKFPKTQAAMLAGFISAVGVAHAAEPVKVDLGAVDVHLPSLLFDCVAPVPHGVVPAPYENVTGNGNFQIFNGKNLYGPVRELQPGSGWDYTSTVKAYMGKVAFANNNLQLFGLEGQSSQVDKVTCFTSTGIKDLTY